MAIDFQEDSNNATDNIDFMPDADNSGTSGQVAGQVAGQNNVPRGTNPMSLGDVMGGNSIFGDIGTRKKTAARETARDLATIGVQYAPFGLAAKAGLEAGAPLIRRFAPKLINSAFKRAAIENAAAGGAYSAVNAEPGQRLKEGAIGTGIGAAAPIPGELANKALIQPLSKWYAQSALPGLVKKATDIFGKEAGPEDSAAALKGSHDAMAATNKLNWNKTNALAKNLDKSAATTKDVEVPSTILNSEGKPLTSTQKQQTTNFTAAPYTKYLKNYIKEKSALEPAQREQYKDALDFAQNKAKDLTPQSFEGVVALRQNLNQHLKDFTTLKGLDRPDANSKALIKGLKKNLIGDTVEANKGNVNANDFDAFKKSWADANDSHQKLQEFYKGISKTGVVKPMQAVREGIQKEGMPDASTISHYLPKAGQTGIDGFKQLEKVMGGKPQAQKALRSYYLREIYQNGGTSKDVAKLFGKFSPIQREYVFGEGKAAKNLGAVNKTLLSLGDEKPHGHLQIIGHHAIGLGLPGLLGYAGARESGLPWDESLGVGLGTALVPRAAAHLIGKFATPESVEAALHLAEHGRRFTGRGTNLLMQTLPSLGARRQQ
jgi:hypothetical protein